MKLTNFVSVLALVLLSVVGLSAQTLDQKIEVSDPAQTPATRGDVDGLKQEATQIRKDLRAVTEKSAADAAEAKRQYDELMQKADESANKVLSQVAEATKAQKLRDLEARQASERRWFYGKISLVALVAFGIVLTIFVARRNGSVDGSLDHVQGLNSSEETPVNPKADILKEKLRGGLGEVKFVRSLKQRGTDLDGGQKDCTAVLGSKGELLVLIDGDRNTVAWDKHIARVAELLTKERVAS